MKFMLTIFMLNKRVAPLPEVRLVRMGHKLIALPHDPQFRRGGVGETGKAGE